ncbi:hypothetical protein NSPZN2_100395 [Nitrospira defluvii]|uniref:Uncharacterized protein n=1 Tax=Nitrospira defluvii TaxID=330214 RepID=A0ABM8R410_9BACT|nr:hypothetical protein NSPZN2_100395 [Nitrospira defluvii]
MSQFTILDGREPGKHGICKAHGSPGLWTAGRVPSGLDGEKVPDHALAAIAGTYHARRAYERS